MDTTKFKVGDWVVRRPNHPAPFGGPGFTHPCRITKIQEHWSRSDSNQMIHSQNHSLYAFRLMHYTHPLPPPTVEELYAAFNQRHPNIKVQLRKLAAMAVNHGIKHAGMKHLIEVLRWNAAIAGDKTPYKINNNFTALYARDLMAENPLYAGLFKTRKRNHEKANITK